MCDSYFIQEFRRELKEKSSISASRIGDWHEYTSFKKTLNSIRKALEPHAVYLASLRGANGLRDGLFYVSEAKNFLFDIPPAQMEFLNSHPILSDLSSMTKNLTECLDRELKSKSFRDFLYKNAKVSKFPLFSFTGERASRNTFSLVRGPFFINGLNTFYGINDLKYLYKGVYFSYLLSSSKDNSDFLLLPSFLAGVMYWSFCTDTDFIYQQRKEFKENPDTYCFPLREVQDGSTFIRSNYFKKYSFDEAIISLSDVEKVYPLLDVISCLSAAAPLQMAVDSAFALEK